MPLLHIAIIPALGGVIGMLLVMLKIEKQSVLEEEQLFLMRTGLIILLVDVIAALIGIIAMAMRLLVNGAVPMWIMKITGLLLLARLVLSSACPVMMIVMLI